jgi:FkbM family methyltransferase
MLPAMTDVLKFLPSEIKLTHTRHGLMLYPARDIFIGPCLQAYGEYCPEEGNAFRQLLRPGDVVVEAGANIGSHTVHLSRIVGPTGQVYAFEPQRRIFQILCANLALNNVANVHARQQGLGCVKDVMWISPPDVGAVANFGGIALGEAGRESVDIVTLDSLNIHCLDMIKIDVEGMEEAVVRGGIETIRSLRPKLYLENDPGDAGLEKSASLIRVVRELGYRLWWHLPALYSAENFRNFRQNIFPKNIVSINMLCIRADEDVKTNFIEVGEDTDRPPL